MLGLVFKLRKISANAYNRSIFENSIGAFLIKGAALLVSLWTIPAYLRYFPTTNIIGLWFTILSVLSWILTFDLGIGNGLRNQLVPALLKKDKNEVMVLISSAYIVIGIFVVASIMISFLLFKHINWNLIFNIPNSIIDRDTLNTTISIIYSGIMLQFLFKLITSVLYSMQKAAINNLLSLISSILVLLYITTTKSYGLSKNLISLALVQILAVNLPLIVASIIIYNGELKGCFPSFKHFRRDYAFKIVKLGGVFFWVQLMYMILTSTNEYLISQLTAPEKVVDYQIYNKMFTLVGTLFVLALTPIWSAITKAIAEQKFVWIRRLYKNLIKFALLAIFANFALIPIMQYGVNFWLGEKAIQVNYLYSFIFATSGAILIWNGMLSSIANGFGELKTQSLLFTIGVAAKFPLAYIWVNYLDSWIGVIIANIMAMMLFCIVQPFLLKKTIQNRVNKSIEGIKLD